MSAAIVIVLTILSATIILFVRGKLGPDVVSLLAILALLFSGALTASEAFAGFGNPAVVTIASVFLVTEGLANTGVAAWIGKRLLRVAGSRQSRLIAVTMTAAALLSLVMNNIASAAVLLPGVTTVARDTRTSPSKLLIPLSFGTLLGGMATLFTTINILVNDMLRAKGLEPFSLFDFMSIGGLVAASGIAFMSLLGRRLLPDYPSKERIVSHRVPADLAQRYNIPEHLFEARILAGSALDGVSMAGSRLGEKHELNVIAIVRAGRIKLAPPREEVLRAGDILMIEGDSASVQQSGEELGLVCQAEQSIQEPGLSDRDTGILEFVVSPYADIVGHSLRETHFREKYGLTVLALRREGQPVTKGVPDLPLQFGDALLVQGPRPRLKLLRSERDFIPLSDPEDMSELHPEKAPIALIALILMVGLAGFRITPIAAASALAAVLMVVSGALTMEAGYRAIEWKAVVMIGGMISMGTALEKSGAASYLSQTLLQALGPFGPLTIMAGFYGVAMLLTQGMSGIATAVLISPIALTTAAQFGINPRPLLMTVIIATSSAFITPVSHPANVLVMGPGGYRFNDYARVGSWMALITFALVMVLVPAFWPL